MRHHSHPFKYPGDWVEESICRDKPQMFYPPDDKPVPRDFYAKAKVVCYQCPVRPECLAYGKDEQYGVWGGTTPAERDQIRNRNNSKRQKIEEALPPESATG